MRHLAGSFNVIGRLIRQHAAKHRDIHRHAIVAQQRRFFFRGGRFSSARRCASAFTASNSAGLICQLFRFGVISGSF
jgi:hypothetical protein